MHTTIIKINCLIIIIIFISLILNSCEVATKGENKNITKSQVLETSISNNSSIEYKTASVNESDSSSLKCTEFAKMNNGTSSINKQVDNSCDSRENPPEVYSDWKIYKYPEYGYEVSYPPDYSPSISGGHSVDWNPEFGMRLSLYSKDNHPTVDIDSIKIDTFDSIDNFIKNKYRGDMTPDESFSINNENHNIYSINGDDYYFVFLSDGSYIFQLSSSSKELLTKIARTFTFI